MAEKTITVTMQCKKCKGQGYLGKGKKLPCNKCVDPATGKPTGRFHKEQSTDTAVRP
jgi:hypothetical protein